MTKEDNKMLADILRQEIIALRKKGYTYRIFFSVINYNASQFYNFMNHGYRMSDEKLMLLKQYIECIEEHDLDPGG